jgi:hypothetical protein
MDPRVIQAAKAAFQYFEAVHRTTLSNMIRDRLGCTPAEADALVDDLVGQHYITIPTPEVQNPRLRIGRALDFETPREPLARQPRSPGA